MFAYDLRLALDSMKRHPGLSALMVLAIALGIAVINIHPPIVLFALFGAYGLSGYATYAYRKAKGKPVSVIATSTDAPEEAGLHR